MVPGCFGICGVGGRIFTFCVFRPAFLRLLFAVPLACAMLSQLQPKALATLSRLMLFAGHSELAVAKGYRHPELTGAGHLSP